VVPIEWHEEKRRLLAKLEVLSREGSAHENQLALRLAIDDYLSSRAAQAVIIDKINVHDLSVPDPMRMAAAIDVRSLPRRARTGKWFWLPKRNGSFRMVCSLSAPLRLALAMAKEILIRTHTPGEHVGDWSGRGPHYSIRLLANDLRDASVVVLADVVNCFPSTNPESACRFGAPVSDLVEANIHPRRVRLCGPKRTIPSTVSDIPSRTGLPGLLRAGPAANVLWAVMIDDLPGALPGGVRANTYADNIAVACRSTQEADAVEASLIEYFADHPAGPFTLRIHRADIDCGFDHLGHNIFRYDGAIHISPKDASLARLDARIENEIRKCDYLLAEVDIEAITRRCCSPWPAITASARDLIREEVRIAAHYPRCPFGQRDPASRTTRLCPSR